MYGVHFLEAFSERGGVRSPFLKVDSSSGNVGILSSEFFLDEYSLDNAFHWRLLWGIQPGIQLGVTGSMGQAILAPVVSGSPWCAMTSAEQLP
ncbi:MAG: hypothetical protein MUF49_28125 [Oculatellaceae cyanobacterium Prado106]|jgi:hypothetical protein|nr:hypothetical protein [Oculatellaceae cyanobacterium Prado106]